MEIQIVAHTQENHKNNAIRNRGEAMSNFYLSQNYKAVIYFVWQTQNS